MSWETRAGARALRALVTDLREALLLQFLFCPPTSWLIGIAVSPQRFPMAAVLREPRLKFRHLVSSPS